MSFCHPPRDADVTLFGDWWNGFGGLNKGIKLTLRSNANFVYFQNHKCLYIL